MINAEVVAVTIENDDNIGQGEASGVYYRQGGDPPCTVTQIEALRERIEAGLTRDSVQSCGARQNQSGVDRIN